MRGVYASHDDDDNGDPNLDYLSGLFVYQLHELFMLPCATTIPQVSHLLLFNSAQHQTSKLVYENSEQAAHKKTAGMPEHLKGTKKLKARSSTGASPGSTEVLPDSRIDDHITNTSFVPP